MEDKFTWEGNVSIKKGLMLKSGFASISEYGIKISTDQSSGSEVMYDIQKHDVVKVELPLFKASKFFYAGYSGFTVIYNDGNKQERLNFWAKGFGAYPNVDNMKTAIEVIGVLFDLDNESIKRSYNQNPFWITMISTGAMILGVVFGGLVGAVLAIIAVYASLKVWENQSLTVTKKCVAIIAILVVTIVIMIICQLSLLLLLSYSVE